MPTAFLLPDDYLSAAEHWCGRGSQKFGSLVVEDDPAAFQPWAQQTWRAPRIVPIRSITDAARILREHGQTWVRYSWNFHRRMTLIQDQLPHIKTEQFSFGEPISGKKMGSWTLLDRDTLLFSSDTDIPFPLGIIPFNENRSDPPSRAYLKLWEAFTRFQQQPKPGEICMDLGASPGGWTWVLAEIGANVVAVDKAPLAENLMKRSSVSFHHGSAFAMQPRDVGAIDWIFSDIICYPKRLLTFVQRWLESGLCKNFLCTLKFQGDDQYDIVKEFKAIPGSQIIHLNHNKHELTWFRTEP